jgi:hypothetical protein
VSRINLNTVKTFTNYEEDWVCFPNLRDGVNEHSFTDGEDLLAASQVIDMIDSLRNGEALIITRDIF